MTYRVVLGAGSKEDLKTHEQSEELRYRSVLEQRDKKLSGGATGTGGTGDEDAQGSLGGTSADGFPTGPGGRGGPGGAGGMGESKSGSSSASPSRPNTTEKGAARGGQPGQGAEKEFDRWLAFTLVVVPDLFMTLEVKLGLTQQCALFCAILAIHVLFLA